MLNSTTHQTYTAFQGSRRIASGTLHDVALAVYRAIQRDQYALPLVFDDHTGTQVDIDLRGNEAEVAARHMEQDAPEPASREEKPTARGRGRPRLGVVAREVTLLPAHWDWLVSQPGGASVALRKLVHEAMRASAGHDQRRLAQERSYKVMTALAGDLPGFEEASRALFAGQTKQMANLVETWPENIREYVLRLAEPGTGSDS